MGRDPSGVLRLMLALTLAASACSSPGASPSTSTNPPTDPQASQIGSQAAARHPVVVDYSPTVSDVGALLYLLSHPGVEVIAITLPVTGEAGCELGLEITLGILAMFDRDDVPVACDSELPGGAEEWPVEFLAGQESLNSGLPAVASAAADIRAAHQLIADVVAASNQPVTLYAVAPLTNVARAIDRHPNLADQLDRIVIMGGAVDASGNVAASDAEWNFWIDVPAAARVVASGAPITLVPLDATDHVPVPGSWPRDLQGAEQGEPVEYLSSLVQIFPAVTSGFFYLWDELAATVAAGEDLVATEEMSLLVVQEPGPRYGSTIRDASGASVVVATAVPDPSSFYAHFLTTLASGLVDARALLLFNEDSAPRGVTPTSSPEEVLAYWLVSGLRGDVEAASSVVVPGAPWVGFFTSADSFVEGTEAYAVSDVELACTSVDMVALCDVTWNDVWISAIPDLERGTLRVRAEIASGRVVAFREFVVRAALVAAFESQTAWLQAEHSSRVQQACAADPDSRACDDLLIATVEEWVASR